MLTLDTITLKSFMYRSIAVSNETYLDETRKLMLGSYKAGFPGVFRLLRQPVQTTDWS